MQLRHLFAAACVTVLAFAPMTANSAPARVGALLTTWDQYYFYAAFDVRDSNVISLNDSLTSHPQQDDDVEVFFETDGARAATVRTPTTIQMAVSANNGSYFSVGDGSLIPKAKPVLDFKFASIVDGKLNSGDGQCKGYTVELAIPWNDLGLSGPPAPGTVWGFNAISRDRDSLTAPAHTLYSLSPQVQSAADVQNPSKWSQITFAPSASPLRSTPDALVCAQVSATLSPVIDGTISAGEWPTNYAVAFGEQGIEAPAPTPAQEPNVGDSLPTPGSAMPPASAPSTPAPGPAVTPAPTRVAAPTAKPVEPAAPQIDTSGHVPLVPQPRVSSRVMALFSLDSAPHDTFDQPSCSLGPWYGLSGKSLVDEMRNARISGVQVLLPVLTGATGDANALRCLVEALRAQDNAGGDYPLLGLWLTGDDPYAAIQSFFSAVPPRYRAQVYLSDAEQSRRAYVVVSDHAVDAASLRDKFRADFGDRATLAIATLTDDSPIALAKVSPGGLSEKGLVARRETETYEEAWDAAIKRSADWVLIDSWNDLHRGTEVSLTRQYADQYANLTRVFASKWRGEKPLAAQIVSCDVPSEIVTKALYQVSVRVENTGMLPWETSDGYSVSYRWYTPDGKLIDDSAPRIPLVNDIASGASTTVSVAVTSQNGFGSWIAPGDYILAIDVVQGSHAWLSYAGSIPLKVPVKIVDPASATVNDAVVLDTTTPEFVHPGSEYKVKVLVRNDGAATWAAAKTNLTLTLKEDGGAGEWTTQTPLTADAAPGDVAEFDALVAVRAITGTGLVASWKLDAPGYRGGCNEHLALTAKDSGPTFELTDMARQLTTGQKTLLNLSLRNGSDKSIAAADCRVSYRIYYLDGQYAGPSTLPPSSLESDLPAGEEGLVHAEFEAPAYPGRYSVVWGLIGRDGSFVADAQAYVGVGDTLPLQIWVSPGHGAKAIPVDLSGQFTERGVAFEGEKTMGFDGAGAALPGEMLPPDGTEELAGNPLLIGTPGMALYPSGYYIGVGSAGWDSPERISFLYPPKNATNVVVAKGQTIAVPKGQCRAVHLLTAAAADAPVEAQFVLKYGKETASPSIVIWPWNSLNGAIPATIAFKSSYRLQSGEVQGNSTCALFDYTLSADPSKTLTALTLPKDARIKILALTLEK